MATRMIQRRGTAAEWTAADPILAAGEIGFETDTSKFKFGDGSTAWSSLPYYTSIDALVDGAPELLDTLNELAAAIGDDPAFITTITSGLDSKLNLTGGTISGNLIVQSDATVGGKLTTSTAPTNPNDVTNKDYVDGLVNPVALDVTNLQNSMTNAEANIQTANTNIATNATDISTINSELAELRRTFIKLTAPTSADNGGNPIEEGSLWYDTSSGNVHIYLDLDGTNFVWVETRGPKELAEVDGSSINAFPTAPNNGDTHEGYIYDASRTAWVVDRSTLISDNTDVEIVSPADDQVLMYNATTGKFENTAGIPLDVDGEIPLPFMQKLQAALTGTATSTSLEEVESYVNTQVSTLETNIVNGATLYPSLGSIETYLGSGLFSDVPALTIKSATDWSTDTSTPLAGSLNVETGGSEIKVKVGNGTDTYANLDYVPTNGSVASDIATAIAPLATKASPTFTGTVSLPADTSIGNVDATEISYLDGVTSSIQSQLTDLDITKADLASPTFTGTVSGIDKSMVGLGNVDNTADADKPISTATQTALDAKAALAGATFTGDVEAPNLVVSGNLTVQGSTTTISASNLSVRDNMLYLNQAGSFTLSGAAGDGTNVVYTTSETHDIKVGDYVTVTGANPASFDISGEGVEVTAVTGTTITVLSTVTDTYVDSGTLRGKSHANPDLGWAAGRYDVTNGSGYGHAGVFRDASDGTFKFFDGYVPEPDEALFIDTSHASFALADLAVADANVSSITFPDGTVQTKAGVPSLTTFTEKTASYTLDTLDHQDNIVEMNMSTAGTFTIPTDAALAWPVGASMDVFATGTGEITIEPADVTVTVNATPGLKLRTQWSSATLLKRGPNSWVVYGDLKA